MRRRAQARWRIIGIGANPGKFYLALTLGATDSINPRDVDKPIQKGTAGMTDGGVDFSFECIGKMQAMGGDLALDPWFTHTMPLDADQRRFGFDARRQCTRGVIHF